ncbi:CSLREA domain-containing protein [Acinetobacter baumannii]|nr:CSLREA domain-containing protein [Acinetobacter baumannii]MCY6441572.1 CSLREA domain-containing protein [Acinetobacter baumannii]
MKNYKKALLALSLLATMPLFADSTNKRIEVTTFADEDGENPNACSLREAIKVAATHKSDYGCTIFSLDDNQAIQLKAGTMIYAELSGDFPLGDSRQPTYKSLRPFDLVS